MKIIFIGGGNMASALIGGMLQQGYNAQDIRVVEISADARDALVKKYGVTTYENAAEAVEGGDVILLSVKPQQLPQVAASLAEHLSNQLIISIAAGIRTVDLSRWLDSYTHIVRAMPNTPALVLAGMTGLYATAGVSPAQRQMAETLLGSAGATLWFDDEAKLDAVTAMSGSGPAYVFYFLEAMQQAGSELGLSEKESRSLAICTFLGATKLAAESVDSAATLRARVTSKGGTTEQALSVMEAAQLKQHMIEAIKQAALRSKQLGDELGKMS